MFDDMDWDMEAAADQEEDCVFCPPAEEDEHCFGLPPADPPETAWVEDPHDPIACCDAEEEAPIDVQNEPEPVHLPIVKNSPENGKCRHLNSKQASAFDWPVRPVRVSPSPAAPRKCAVPQGSAADPRWWTDMDFDQKRMHVEAMTRNEGWKISRSCTQARWPN